MSVYVDSTGTVEAARAALTSAMQAHFDREWVHMGGGWKPGLGDSA